MKVVVLTLDQPNQAALCRKLEMHCEIAAIVLSQNVPRKRPAASSRLHSLINRVSARLVGRPFIAAWQQLQRSYAELYGDFPDARLVRVKNINDAATIQVVEETSPDLIIVSGTNLVGRKFIEIASRRSVLINLHTGLSPYIKGGPNCTNWCLAEKNFHLIGNTVMWLDAGIDSGNIIASEQTTLSGSEALTELHWKVMEHAHAMCVCVVSKLASGEFVPSVPQDSVGSGKTFYNVDWNARAMLQARYNFKHYYQSYFTDRERQLVESGTVVVPILEQS